jgi:hypothetical protein
MADTYECKLKRAIVDGLMKLSSPAKIDGAMVDFIDYHKAKEIVFSTKVDQISGKINVVELISELTGTYNVALTINSKAMQPDGEGEGWWLMYNITADDGNKSIFVADELLSDALSECLDFFK